MSDFSNIEQEGVMGNTSQEGNVQNNESSNVNGVNDKLIEYIKDPNKLIEEIDLTLGQLQSAKEAINEETTNKEDNQVMRENRVKAYDNLIGQLDKIKIDVQAINVNRIISLEDIKKIVDEYNTVKSNIGQSDNEKQVQGASEDLQQVQSTPGDSQQAQDLALNVEDIVESNMQTNGRSSEMRYANSPEFDVEVVSGIATETSEPDKIPERRESIGAIALNEITTEEDLQRKEYIRNPPKLIEDIDSTLEKLKSSKSEIEIVGKKDPYKGNRIKAYDDQKGYLEGIKRDVLVLQNKGINQDDNEFSEAINKSIEEYYIVINNINILDAELKRLSERKLKRFPIPFIVSLEQEIEELPNKIDDEIKQIERRLALFDKLGKNTGRGEVFNDAINEYNVEKAFLNNLDIKLLAEEKVPSIEGNYNLIVSFDKIRRKIDETSKNIDIVLNKDFEEELKNVLEGYSDDDLIIINETENTFSEKDSKGKEVFNFTSKGKEERKKIWEENFSVADGKTFEEIYDEYDNEKKEKKAKGDRRVTFGDDPEKVIKTKKVIDTERPVKKKSIIKWLKDKVKRNNKRKNKMKGILKKENNNPAEETNPNIAAEHNTEQDISDFENTRVDDKSSIDSNKSVFSNADLIFDNKFQSELETKELVDNTSPSMSEKPVDDLSREESEPENNIPVENEQASSPAQTDTSSIDINWNLLEGAPEKERKVESSQNIEVDGQKDKRNSLQIFEKVEEATQANVQGSSKSGSIFEIKTDNNNETVYSAKPYKNYMNEFLNGFNGEKIRSDDVISVKPYELNYKEINQAIVNNSTINVIKEVNSAYREVKTEIYEKIYPTRDGSLNWQDQFSQLQSKYTPSSDSPTNSSSITKPTWEDKGKKRVDYESSSLGGKSPSINHAPSLHG